MNRFVTIPLEKINIPGCYLYFKKEHLELQSLPMSGFAMEEDGRMQMFMPVFFTDEKAYSPLRGHFGGIQLLDKVSKSSIQNFLEKIEQYLKGGGIKEIAIKQAAETYHAQSNLVHEAYHSLGYQITYEEKNYHIPVKGTFEQTLHASAKRRLQKCQKEGLACFIRKDENLQEVYELFVASRKEKGYPLTMQQSDFQQLFDRFPDEHFIFEVRFEKELVAALIAIRNHEKVLYAFYPAHKPSWNAFSPLIFLYHHVYQFCQAQRIEMIDLGIATDSGVDNEGLIRFKKNLGGEVSRKIEYFKQL